MNRRLSMERKLRAKSIAFFSLVILFTICMPVCAATIEVLDIEEGDFIWSILDVDTTGLVSVNAWTEDNNNDIYLYLYDETGVLVASDLSTSYEAHIDYIASTTGTYTVKTHLHDSYYGNPLNLSVSSNRILSLRPKYNGSAFIDEGDAVWYDLSVEEGQLTFLYSWTEGNYNDIYLYLYSETGVLVASDLSTSYEANIDHIASTTGTYTVKTHLHDSYYGNPLNLSASSNRPFVDTFTTITIDISEEPAPIENFTDTSAVSPFYYWCDLRWVGEGVWPSMTKYYTNDEILCYVQFINYPHEDSYDCSYIFEGRLYAPSGKQVDYIFDDYAIKKGVMIEYKPRFPAPATGWDPGRYKFCCTVEPRLCDGIEKCCTFDVRPPNPDLVLTSVWFINNTIYYKIKNRGHKTAGSSNTSLTVDGVFMTSDSVSSLDSGATATGSFNYTWNCTNTNDTIEVCADYIDEVYEYSDSNNCQTKTWTCPDLTITNVWFVNNTMIHYNITNNGDKTACASKTSLTVEGVFMASDSVASLEHGVERTGIFNYTWICTNPSDMIEVCTDYTDNIMEGNESNNCRTETWACLPDIWISPSLFDVRLESGVVSNYTLAIGNNWIGTLEFNVSDAVDFHVTSQQGWPKTTGGSVYSSPALGDIDGDGDIEVVVGSYNDRKVHAWHHDGSIVSGWPKMTGGWVYSSPALGDIDGDGNIEVVIGSHGDKRVYAWHHDGSSVSGWPKTTNGVVDSSPALDDIDGDGDLEIVIDSFGKVYAWHHDGSTVTGWPKTTNGSMKSSPALGDLDGDGDIEVVVGSHDKKVYAWHHDGSIVTGWPKTTNGSVESSPALGDIDGDGDIEVVVGSDDKKMYAWHHDGSTVTGWPKTTNGVVESSPALGDIDGDGDIEVVVGSGYAWERYCMVYAWHHDGSTVTGWPKTTGSGVSSSPALGDIDGDGDIEVVVGSYFDKKVYAWHHDGSTVTGWPKTTGGHVKSSPAMGDIDGDGDIEIVIGSSDNKVNVWDCSGMYNLSNIEWGTFQHDVRRTGLYETMYPKRGGWLSEHPTNGKVYQGSQTDITITFNTAGLPFGEYHANITITSNDPDENPVIIPVRLTVAPSSEKGDFNGNGRVDIGDVAKVAFMVAGKVQEELNADFNGNGRVDIGDAAKIAFYLAGKVSEL